MTIYRSLVISALGGSLALAASPTDSFGAAGSWIGSLINDTIAGAAKGFLQPGQPWHWSPGGSIPWWGGHGPGSHGCKQIQYRFPPGTNGPGTESAQRAEAIKQAYVSAWDEYAKYAFGADGFNPVTMTSEGDGSGGWGLIIIDGVDTAITMGLKDIADQQLAWIAAQDFTKTSSPQIDGFDTTIRLIAGLLSAHDLITSGKVPYALEYNREHVQACLNGARDLADLLSPIFDTPTGLPYFWLNTTTHTGFAGPSNTAVDGTIILEYHRLSDLTGDPKYRQQADKAEAWLINPQPPPVYPGLVGSNVDMDTGKFTNENAGWQSGIDSFFEYLIKSVVYDPTQEFARDYQNFWTTAVESTIQHLAVHPYDHPELTFITILNDTGYPLWQMDDYSAFAGGNFLLGGAYLGREDFISLGLAFTDSCHSLYNSTASGLNPLSLGWYGPDNLSTEPIYNDNSTYTGQLARQQADEHGYYIRYDIGSFVSGAFYTLYPEPIESMLYAWRISGDTRWQEYNWEVFQAIQRDAHRGAVAVSSLYNVSAPLGGDEFGDVPSYYFAETLKYLYLTFADPNLVSLDDFVFNTECHPFRIQRGTCSTPWSFP